MFFCVAADLEISVILEPKKTEISIEMDFRNLTGKTCQNLRTNICASVNHLPGEPGWSNRDFVPDHVPLDRDLQGRYWYEESNSTVSQSLGWRVVGFDACLS